MRGATFLRDWCCKYPVYTMVEIFGTGKYDNEKLAEAVNSVFNLYPSAIVKYLDLRKSIYQKIACNGHMGNLEVKWEEIDKVDDLKDYFKI